MRRAIVHQGAFASGEIDPRAVNRVDTQQYALGAKRLKNLVITSQGNLRRRNSERYLEDILFDFEFTDAAPRYSHFDFDFTGAQTREITLHTINPVAQGSGILYTDSTPANVPTEDFWMFEGLAVNPNRDPADYGDFLNPENEGIILRGRKANLYTTANWEEGQYRRNSGNVASAITNSAFVTLETTNYIAKLKGVRYRPDSGFELNFDGPLLLPDGTYEVTTQLLKVNGETFVSSINDYSVYILDSVNRTMKELWISAAQEVDYTRNTTTSESDTGSFGIPRSKVSIIWKDLRENELPFYDQATGNRIQSAGFCIAIGKKGLSADEVFPVKGKKPTLRIVSEHDTLETTTVVLENLPETPSDMVFNLQEFADLELPTHTQWTPYTTTLWYDPTLVNNETQWSIDMKLKKIDVNIDTKKAPEKVPMAINRRDDEGIAVLAFTKDAIVPFHTEETEGGVIPKSQGCYLLYGKTIETPELFRWVATRAGWIIVHPELKPFALIRNANGIYMKNELDAELLGTPDDFKPAAVGLYHGRLYFAGTDEFPQGIWASRAGNITDFDWENSDPDQPGSPFFFNLEGSGRIHSIVTGTHLSFLSESEHWFRTAQEPPTPSNFGVQRGVQRGADKRVAPADINGNLGYINTGLGEIVQSVYLDEVKGFLPQPLSLPASHLFRSSDLPHQPAIAFDATEENYFLMVAPGNGNIALASIVPGGTMGFSEFEVYDATEGPNDIGEESTRVDIIGCTVADGMIWAITKNGTDTRLCVIDLVERPSSSTSSLPWEFETLPVLLPNNEGSGVDGGSFTTYRRIVTASVDMAINEQRRNETAIRLNGRDWRRLTESGLQRFQGLRGWSRRATFRMEGTAPVEIMGVSLEAIF